jgi:fructan beta-fructosidase
VSYRFHASAPPGEWINDPNALFFRDGRYQLLVQHAADVPDFRHIGWGRLTSPDLMDWRWEGVTLPPDAEVSRYSGSLAGDCLFFTDHDRARIWQRQRQAALAPDASSAEPIPGGFGPEGRNVRDPFVWWTAQGWRMLVALPCDWTDWRTDPRSTLQLWASPDLEQWEQIAAIGPWSPAGVLWEVPAVIDFGERQALILSLVDRRGDETRCEVRYWVGRFDADGFTRDPSAPEEGLLLDHGPDLYAAIPNVPEDWPLPDRVVIGWASSWRTARSWAAPDARGGGPIAMPRRVSLVGDRLLFSPAIARRPDWTGPLPLTIANDEARLLITAEQDCLTVKRDGPELWGYHRTANAPIAPDAHAQCYVDGPLFEVFWSGLTITALLPGVGPPRIGSGSV